MHFDGEQLRPRSAHDQGTNAECESVAGPTALPAGTFFGENDHSFSRSGFLLSDTCYPPALKVPYHYHELAYFCLLVKGGYWEEYGKRRVTYQPLSIVFHPPQEVHRGALATSGGRCFHVEIASQWLARLREHGPAPTEAVDLHSGEIISLASRLYREFRRGAFVSPLIIEGIILEMLGLLVREPCHDDRPAPRWLKLAADRLQCEFARSLTVEELAADLDVNPIRLSRAFRKIYGESIGDYLRRIRVQFASRRLADPGASLSEVGSEAGFADQSHFTRVFKRITGMTPGEFQRTRRIA